MRWAFPLVFLFFSSCSWFSSSKSDETMTEYAPRIVNSIPAPKPLQREPGSLWSEDSRWNDIYNPTQARYPGDVITIKLNQGLKAKILAAVDSPEKRERLKEEEEEKAERAKEAKASGRPEAKQEAASAAAGGAASGQNDTKSIEATILEVMPRGIYRVSANRGVRIGAADPYVAMQAQLREKEIAGDETVSSDVLFNVQLEVIRTDDLKEVKNPEPTKGG